MGSPREIVSGTVRDNRLSIERTIDHHLIIGDPVDRMASLTAFVRVVESGGFTAAARRLDLSPTMVSNHIRALEDSLGVRLLNGVSAGRPHARANATGSGPAVSAIRNASAAASRPWVATGASQTAGPARFRAR